MLVEHSMAQSTTVQFNTVEYTALSLSSLLLFSVVYDLHTGTSFNNIHTGSSLNKLLIICGQLYNEDADQNC